MGRYGSLWSPCQIRLLRSSARRLETFPDPTMASLSKRCFRSKMTPTTSPISASLDSERQRAMRAILQQPLLGAQGPYAEAYLLVRRHAQWLKEWFSRHPDWNFHIDSEIARLRKTPSDFADGTRPAVDPSRGASFTKRRYVLLCLALATLEQSEE